MQHFRNKNNCGNVVYLISILVSGFGYTCITEKKMYKVCLCLIFSYIILDHICISFRIHKMNLCLKLRYIKSNSFQINKTYIYQSKTAHFLGGYINVICKLGKIAKLSYSFLKLKMFLQLIPLVSTYNPVFKRLNSIFTLITAGRFINLPVAALKRLKYISCHY